MKATEHYFSVVLFATLYKVAITLECVDVVEPPMKPNAPYSYMKTVLSQNFFIFNTRFEILLI